MWNKDIRKNHNSTESTKSIKESFPRLMSYCSQANTLFSWTDIYTNNLLLTKKTPNLCHSPSEQKIQVTEGNTLMRTRIIKGLNLWQKSEVIRFALRPANTSKLAANRNELICSTEWQCTVHRTCMFKLQQGRSNLGIRKGFLPMVKITVGRFAEGASGISHVEDFYKIGKLCQKWLCYPAGCKGGGLLK